MITLKPINNFDEAQALITKVFKKFYPNHPDSWFEHQIDYADVKLSIGAYDHNTLIGVYLLTENSLSSEMEGRGLEGIALCVLDSYRGKGIGSLLVEKAESLGFDYIWGEQAKVLKNMKFWSTRTIYLETETSFFSFKKLK